MPTGTRRTKGIKRVKRKGEKVKKVKKEKKPIIAGVNQGVGSNALDASSKIDVNKVDAPTTSFDSNMLNDIGRDMVNLSTFRTLENSGDPRAASNPGIFVNNRADYVSANNRTLQAANDRANSFLRDNSVDPTGSTTQMVGAVGTDFKTSGPSGVLNASDSFRRPSQKKVGENAVTILDKATGGSIGSMTRSDYIKDTGGFNSNTGGANFGTIKGEGNNTYTSGNVGFGGNIETQMLAYEMPRTNKDGAQVFEKGVKSKYSPFKSETIRTRQFQTAAGQDHTSTNPTSGVVSTVNNPGLRSGTVTKVAPQYNTRENLGKDAFSDLSVEEKLTNVTADRRSQARKGSRKGSIGKARKNKVQKIKGQVDLDMSGKVDTNLERNAKAFVGMENVYSTRGAARRDLKGKTKDKDRANQIKGRAFDYKQNGKNVSEKAFVTRGNRNITNFNRNQTEYNTAQVNAGVGGRTLTGENSYASRLGVNTNSAFGQGGRKKLTSGQLTTNTKMKKYKKLQKKLNRKNK